MPARSPDKLPSVGLEAAHLQQLSISGCLLSSPKPVRFAFMHLFDTNTIKTAYFQIEGTLFLGTPNCVFASTEGSFLFLSFFLFRIVEQKSLHAINVTSGLIHGARRSAVAQQYRGFRVGPRGITADGKMRSEQQRGRHVEPRRWPLKRALIIGINLQVCDWTLIIRGPIAPNANCILIGALNDAFFPLISPPRQRINGILSSWYRSNSRSVSSPSNWFKRQTYF